MAQTTRTVLIAGAGPAALTAARELLRTGGIKPILFEEADFVGGISATRVHNGNRMDMGGHRFFSKDDAILRWWTEVLPVQAGIENPAGPDPEQTDQVMLVRRRVSRIFYLRKFFDYPLSLKFATFANMGPRRTVSAGMGYLGAKIAPRKERTLEDFMINRFGAPLYRMFFEGYTEKVWGVHPKRLSPDWGAQRIKGLSMGKVLAQALRDLFQAGSKDIKQKETETSLIERFLYPKYGPGHFWETVAADVVRLGGEIRLCSRVTAVNLQEGKVVSLDVRNADGTTQTVEGDAFFSSMPVRDLVGAIRGADVPEPVRAVAAALPYRDFMTVGLLVKKLKLADKKSPSGRIDDCWIYIQEPDVKIGRLQVFNNWSPYLVKDPDNTVFLGLEYFCDEGDETWNMSDEAFIAFAQGELAKIGIIDEADVLDAVRIKVKKAYPAYFGAYERFDTVRDWLDGVENLYCIGRNGQHRYNNMDHSMLTAMEAVRAYMSGSADKSAIWSVNSEESYHESKRSEGEKSPT